MQQLEHLVEAGRIARPRGADRVDARQVPLNERGLEEGLPGPHPVAVARQRVDLAVVAQVAVGVRQRPARERVGREARVHQRQARLERRVAQVGEELAQLLRRQHPLVDDGAGRQRREVEAVDGVLDPLAQHEGASLERHRVDAGPRGRHEDLLDHGHGAERDLAQPLGLGRHPAPPEHRQPLLEGRVLHHGAGLERVVRVRREEGEAHRVAARLGQREARRLGGRRQEPVRDLHQDARPVSRVHLGARGAPVGQALQHGEPPVDDVVVGAPVEIGHHADTTGVVLVCRVVEASGHRRPSE